MTILRLMTCGSVDDGKSTLIGRLLVETDSVPFDTVASARSTRRSGSTIESGEIDFSLLTGGLEAEREQGITIDVAYQSMSLLDGRRLIIADTPGHEQYTRNMVVAASRSEIALVLVDASKGISTQTHRHLTICALMGIKKIIVAINKMDLVDLDESVFSRVLDDVAKIGERLGFSATVIPICALHGDNVVAASTRMSWYSGETVIQAIQNWQPPKLDSTSAYMPIQVVSRTENFRGVSGTVIGAGFAQGEKVTILPSESSAVITKIYSSEGEVEVAADQQAVTLVLSPEIDASRGHVVVGADSDKRVSKNIVANLVWLGDRELVLGHSYLFNSGFMQSPVEICDVRHVIDVNSGESTREKVVDKNSISEVELKLNIPLLLTNYGESKELGNFILVDRENLHTVAAGMIIETETKSENVSAQKYETTRDERVRINGHDPHVIWLTGLSGSGKSTLANVLEQRLLAEGIHTFVLDGDNLRLGLNKDLGFSRQDRAENVRRVSEVARIMADAGFVVIVALVSPFELDRQAASSLFENNEFSEVWVNTPVDICQERDPKGLYKRARSGEISNFTGVGQEYEPPVAPRLVLDGTAEINFNVELLRSLIGKLSSQSYI